MLWPRLKVFVEQRKEGLSLGVVQVREHLAGLRGLLLTGVFIPGFVIQTATLAPGGLLLFIIFA